MGVIDQLVKQALEGSVKGVRRPGVAADLAGAWDIFTVVNGPVLVTQMWGHVTTVIANAAVPIMMFNPTGAAPNAALAAIMVSIAADAAGTIYTWTGAAGGVPGPAAQIGMASAGESVFAGNFIFLVPGVINFTNAVAGTGVIDWYINYIPCYTGAKVEPA